jgi:hypothetical protein
MQSAKKSSTPVRAVVLCADLMDARNVRIGETGLEQLIQWLRQTGRPQTLEALTEQYLVILKELVLSEEVR